jgi:hypothetical protein
MVTHPKDHPATPAYIQGLCDFLRDALQNKIKDVAKKINESALQRTY